MKNVRVYHGEAAVVTFIDKQGRRCSLPMMKLDDEWQPVGVYKVHGTSASDPTFATIFALPYRWKPNNRIKNALRRTRRG